MGMQQLDRLILEAGSIYHLKTNNLNLNKIWLKIFTSVKDKKNIAIFPRDVEKMWLGYLQYIKGVNQKKRHKDGNIYKS